MQELSCPGCTRKISITNELIGKKIKCRDCNYKMVVPRWIEQQEVLELHDSDSAQESHDNKEIKLHDSDSTHGEFYNKEIELHSSDNYQKKSHSPKKINQEVGSTQTNNESKSHSNKNPVYKKPNTNKKTQENIRAGSIILTTSVVLYIVFAIIPSIFTQKTKTEAIESVLNQHAKTIKEADSVEEVVRRMREPDLSQCPYNFKAAYLTHIHAWENLEPVIQEIKAFAKARGGAGDFVESFIRGFLGDPLGKFHEIQSQHKEIKKAYDSAMYEIKQTYNKVEKIAITYDAQLPKR